MIRRGYLALTLALGSGVATAALPSLELPVRCALPRECFIQNYVDHDSGPGRRDYQCGFLSYDGHAGTDFRVRDLPAMEAGTLVVASAAGKVAGVRDGEPDVSVNERGRAALNGKDAGNAVRIEHGDGWETQYSHLRKGSVRVRVGEQVVAGTPLGLIGLSGRTEFPHVDFVVRRAGKVVDPFNPDHADCGKAKSSLWSAAALQALDYVASGELIAGFSTEPARREAAEAGQYAMTTIAGDVPLLAFWVELFGVLPGDRLQMRIEDAAGQVIARGESQVERPMAIWFGQVTRRDPGKGVKAPINRRFVGVLVWQRNGRELTQVRREIIMRDDNAH